MEGILSILYGLTIFWIALNGLLIYPFIEKRTRYIGNTQGDMTNTRLLWVTMLIGIFVLPFIKTFRIYRKHYYLKNRIRFLKWSDRPFFDTGYKGDNMFDKDIARMERIYKISKIKQKAKRNKLKKKLFLK